MPKKSLVGDIIIELSDIDSTNNYAMRLINEGMAEHGVAIRADFQTNGKGQLGNVWQAEESKNLLLSIILDTHTFPIENQFYLNVAACISVADILMSQYDLRDVSIKWPNDIYAGKKKIAGILIENNIRGSVWTNAIIGIGLNVNQELFQDLNRATSISIENGKPYKVNQVMKQLLKYFNKYYTMAQQDKEYLLKLYNKLLMGVDTMINYSKKFEFLQGELLGVDEQGLLTIRENGKMKKYQHKEVLQVID